MGLASQRQSIVVPAKLLGSKFSAIDEVHTENEIALLREPSYVLLSVNVARCLMQSCLLRLVVEKLLQQVMMDDVDFRVLTQLLSSASRCRRSPELSARMRHELRLNEGKSSALHVVPFLLGLPCGWECTCGRHSVTILSGYAVMGRKDTLVICTQG